MALTSTQETNLAAHVRAALDPRGVHAEDALGSAMQRVKSKKLAQLMANYAHLDEAKQKEAVARDMKKWEEDTEKAFVEGARKGGAAPMQLSQEGLWGVIQGRTKLWSLAAEYIKSIPFVGRHLDAGYRYVSAKAKTLFGGKPEAGDPKTYAEALAQADKDDRNTGAGNALYSIALKAGMSEAEAGSVADGFTAALGDASDKAPDKGDVRIKIEGGKVTIGGVTLTGGVRDGKFVPTSATASINGVDVPLSQLNAEKLDLKVEGTEVVIPRGDTRVAKELDRLKAHEEVKGEIAQEKYTKVNGKDVNPAESWWREKLSTLKISDMGLTAQQGQPQRVLTDIQANAAAGIIGGFYASAESRTMSAEQAAERVQALLGEKIVSGIEIHPAVIEHIGKRVKATHDAAKAMLPAPAAGKAQDGYIVSVEPTEVKDSKSFVIKAKVPDAEGVDHVYEFTAKVEAKTVGGKAQQVLTVTGIKPEGGSAVSLDGMDEALRSVTSPSGTWIKGGALDAGKAGALIPALNRVLRHAAPRATIESAAAQFHEERKSGSPRKQLEERQGEDVDYSAALPAPAVPSLVGVVRGLLG